jgi:hydrogenase maturation protease
VAQKDLIFFHYWKGCEGESIPAFLSSKLSVHQIGLPDLLFAAKLMEITPPEMCLVGIQPKSMETTTEFSDEIKAQFKPFINTVLRKLKDWGVEAVEKTM